MSGYETVPVPDVPNDADVDAAVARLQPGDILILRPHADLIPRQCREYNDAMQARIPDNQVIVTVGPADLAILRPVKDE